MYDCFRATEGRRITSIAVCGSPDPLQLFLLDFVARNSENFVVGPRGASLIQVLSKQSQNSVQHVFSPSFFLPPTLQTLKDATGCCGKGPR
jgi:hypothetical protein